MTPDAASAVREAWRLIGFEGARGARDFVDEATRRFPDDDDLHALEVYVAQREGRVADAQVMIAERPPRGAGSLAVRSYVALRSGDLDAAICFSEKAMGADPRHFLALRFAATVAARLGDHDEVLRLLGTLQEIAPDDPSVLAQRLATLMNMGRIDEARAELEAAPASFRGTHWDHFDRGLLASKDQDFATAREAFRRCTEIAPNSLRAWAMLGMMERHFGGQDAAVAAITRALDLDPRSVMGLQQAVKLPPWKDDPEVEARLADAMRALPPGWEEQRHAIALMAAGKWGEAGDVFARLVSESGNVGQLSRANLVTALRMQRRHAEAKEALLRAIEMDGLDPRLRRASLELAVEGEMGDAVRDAEELLATPQRSVVLSTAVRILHRAGDTRRALELAREALAHRGIGNSAKTAIAAEMAVMGATEEACRYVTDALRATPGDPVLVEIASMLARRGAHPAAQPPGAWSRFTRWLREVLAKR